MIEIRTFTENDTNEIIQLVLHCQNDGTRPMVTVEDQPELLHIKETYLDGGGNFWVAVKQERVVGSIGLMDCGGGLGLLKKFFVYEEYRGEPVKRPAFRRSGRISCLWSMIIPMRTVISIFWTYKIINS